MLGPPAEERAHRLDERRVQDLQAIGLAADLYWTRHGRLPASLADLSGESGTNIASGDPDNAEPYGYRIIDDRTYELCGLFERETAADRFGPAAAGFWAHGAGRRCFQLKVREARR